MLVIKYTAIFLSTFNNVLKNNYYSLYANYLELKGTGFVTNIFGCIS